MSSKFEVGKKYTTKAKTAPRTCLKVTDQYVLLDEQEGILYSRPINVDRIHWSYWNEYKPPVILKYYIPVVTLKGNKMPFFAYDGISSYDRETAKHFVKKSGRYELVDVVEVTWTEGDKDGSSS